MIEVGGELALLREGSAAEAPAHGAADFERRQIREDAEHRGHIRMQHAAVADGEIEREVVAPRPGAEDFGIGRQQHRGRRQPGSRRAGLECGPHAWRERSVVAAKARVRQARGIDGERERRRRRQGVHPRRPIRPRGVRLRRQRLHVQHVVPKRQRCRGSRRRSAFVPIEYLLQETVDALAIEDQGIDAEVQPPVIRGHARDAKLEQRPAIGGQHLVRHPLAHGARGSLRLRQWRCTVIREGDHERWYLLQDPLRPVGLHHCTQHRMPRNRRPPRLLETLDVEPTQPEFHVHVARDVAKIDQSLASEPVRLLHRRERKGCMRRGEVRYQRRAVLDRQQGAQRACEVGEDWGVEDRAEGQLAAQSHPDLRRQGEWP